MSRFVAFLYGLAAYLVFFVTFLYAIGFVTGLVVPKTIDTGAVVPLAEALIVNLLLMSLFAVQHSVMARKQFKEWWTQYRAEVGRTQHLRAAREPRARCCCSGSGGRSRRWSGRSPIRRSRWRSWACRLSAGCWC